MARTPGATPVKSRLHRVLGADGATALYRCFLLDRVASLAALPGLDLTVAFTPSGARDAMAALLPGVRLLAQRGGDLGVRMANAIEDVARDGARGVVVIGSDSPTLPLARVTEAAAAVAAGSADLVLGPAEDGGYYLVAQGRPCRDVFADVPWSTAHVLERTLAHAERLGLRVLRLASWYDVDTEADLRRLRDELASVDAPAPRTREFLRGLPA